MKAISSYMLSGISVLSLVLIGSCCSPQHSMDSYRGRALALWLDDLRSAETQEDYARASNAVHRIGRNAVPFLLQLSQSTNEPTIQKARPVQFLLKTPLGTDESRLRAALACRAIGSAAEPVIRKLTSELTNNATTSTEIEQQIRAVEVLVNIGPGAFSPLLSVIAPSPESPNPVVIDYIRQGIKLVIVTDPRNALSALFQSAKDEKEGVRSWAEYFLIDALETELFAHDAECGSVYPVVKEHFLTANRIVRVAIARYLGRCGPSAQQAISIVEKLLRDPDLIVRSEATNALNAMDHTGAVKRVPQ